MQKTEFKIYWTDLNQVTQSSVVSTLSSMLSITETLRKEGNTFIASSCANVEHIGKSGVDSIVDGKTPQGDDYTWSKAGRAGKPKRKDVVITTDDH